MRDGYASARSGAKPPRPDDDFFLPREKAPVRSSSAWLILGAGLAAGLAALSACLAMYLLTRDTASARPAAAPTVATAVNLGPPNTSPNTPVWWAPAAVVVAQSSPPPPAGPIAPVQATPGQEVVVEHFRSVFTSGSRISVRAPAAPPAPPVGPAAPAPGPAAAAQPPPRAPVPSLDDRQKAWEPVEATFREQLESRDPAAAGPFIDHLLQQGIDTTSDPATRCVLFEAARRMSIDRGDAQKAAEAVALITRHFVVDESAERQKLLRELEPTITDDLQRQALAEMALDLAPQRLEAERFDDADEAVKVAERAASKCGNVPMAGQARQLARRIAFARDASATADTARQALKDRPDDPAASAALGRYLCLVLGDWAGGLLLLDKGDDDELKTLADRELRKQPADTFQKLADGWWAWSQSQGEDGWKRAGMARAVGWYERAIPDLSGFPRTLAESRVREFGEKYASVEPGWFPLFPYDPARSVPVGPGGFVQTDAMKRDLAPRGSILVGFDFAYHDAFGGPCVQAVRPIYQRLGAHVRGAWTSPPVGPVQTVIARPGYAVGSLFTKAGLILDGFQLTFYRVRGQSLDAADSYTSAYYGHDGGGPATIASDRRLVIGVLAAGEGELKALGLIVVP